jgi:hypothetical protein
VPFLSAINASYIGIIALANLFPLLETSKMHVLSARFEAIYQLFVIS